MSQNSPGRRWLVVGTAALFLLGIAWGISAITAHDPSGIVARTLTSSSSDASTAAGGHGSNGFEREGNKGGRESGRDDSPNERPSQRSGLNPADPGGGSTAPSTPGPTV